MQSSAKRKPETIDSSRYRFLELAARPNPACMIRHYFVSIENAEAVARWQRDHNNRDIFASVCRFPEPQRGPDYVCPFFLDIDAEGDLETARRETLVACNLLAERLGIRPESQDIYFSGSKGFHVLVPAEVFLASAAPNLISIWRALAHRIAHHGVPHLDRNVYDASRLLRLPDSVHSKSGLYKVAMDFVELEKLDVGEIRELASTERGLRSMADPSPVAKAVDWFCKAATWIAQQPESGRTRPTTTTADNGWQTPPCIRRIEMSVLPDGSRHAAYYAMARFYATTGMAPEEAIRRLVDIDARHPIRDPDYLHRVVANAWRKPGFRGCPNPVLEAYCDRRSCQLSLGAAAHRRGAADGANGRP